MKDLNLLLPLSFSVSHARIVVFLLRVVVSVQRMNPFVAGDPTTLINWPSEMLIKTEISIARNARSCGYIGAGAGRVSVEFTAYTTAEYGYSSPLLLLSLDKFDRDKIRKIYLWISDIHRAISRRFVAKEKYMYIN